MLIQKMKETFPEAVPKPEIPNMLGKRVRVVFLIRYCQYCINMFNMCHFRETSTDLLQICCLDMEKK